MDHVMFESISTRKILRVLGFKSLIWSLFLITVHSTSLHAQFPNELIEGIAEDIKIKNVDNTLYLIGKARGELKLSNELIEGSDVYKGLMFVLEMDRNTMSINKQWTFRVDNSITLTSFEVSNDKIYILGNYNNKLTLGSNSISNSNYGSFLFEYNFSNKNEILTHISSGNIRLSDIELTGQDELIIGGNSPLKTIKVRSTTIKNPTGDVCSFLIHYNKNNEVKASKYIPGAILHEIKHHDNQTFITGTIFKNFKADGQELSTKGYKLFVAAFDEFAKCLWVTPLSGESTCAEMNASLYYDEGQKSIFTTGFYSGYSEYIPIGFYHAFFSRIDVEGKMKWFRKLNNLPFSLSNIQLQKVNGDYEVSAFQRADCFIGGLEFSKADNQWLKCKFDENCFLKTISIHESSPLFPSTKTIEVNQPFENIDYPASELELKANSLGSDFDVQFIDARGSTQHFLVLSVKGVKRYGHAGIILVRVEDGIPTIINSHVLLATNEKDGVFASLGVRSSGSTEKDFFEYNKGLIFTRDSLPKELKGQFLNSNSTRIIYGVDEKVFTKIDAHLSLLNKKEYTSLSATENSITRIDSFYERIESDFIEIGNLMEMDLSSSNEVILPDNLHSMIRSFQFKDLNLLPLNDSPFSYRYGEVPEDLEQLDGVTFYKDCEVVLKNGQVLEYISYEGEIKSGKPHGIGNLKYRVLNEMKYNQADILSFSGSFVDGLFGGEGKVIADTLILFEGEYLEGVFNSGTAYSYYWQNHKLISKCQYENANLNGLCHEYYPLLDIESPHTISEYEHGQLNGGMYTFYLTSKKIKTLQRYNKGIAEGKKISFFYDGKVYNEKEKSFVDTRFAITKSQKDNHIDYFYADYDPEGFGNLLFHTDDYVNWDKLDKDTKFENKVYYDRVFNFPNGDVHTVKNEASIYQYAGGDILISKYGFVEDYSEESVSITGEIPCTHKGKKEIFYGNYVLYLSDNSKLSGVISDGTTDGPAKYLTPKNEIQDIIVKDGSWTWTYKEERYSSNFFKKGLQKLNKGVFGVIDDIGEGICKLFGKDVEEGDSCGGGLEIDSDGNVRLLDMNGNPVPTNPTQNDQIHIYTTYEYTEFDQEVIFDGTTKFIEEAKLKQDATKAFGQPWPGMKFGEAIFPPNGTGLIRNDKKGKGHFLASRKKGEVKYGHKGMDYKVSVGDVVISPVSGEVLRISNAYTKNSMGLKAVVIKNAGYIAKVLYLKPYANIKIGSKVVMGETALGKAQDLKPKHGPVMTNHIHVELYDPTKRLIPPNGKYPNM